MTPRLAGALVAALTLAADQANKLWLIDVYDIADRQPVRLAPFFDVIFAQNPGISYSLLSAHSPAARWALVAFTAVASFDIGLWLWRTTTSTAALGLGLILGGALGKAIDRFAYGWVADFCHLHVGGCHWYVFNLADVSIVAGVGRQHHTTAARWSGRSRHRPCLWKRRIANANLCEDRRRLLTSALGRLSTTTVSDVKEFTTYYLAIVSVFYRRHNFGQRMVKGFGPFSHFRVTFDLAGPAPHRSDFRGFEIGTQTETARVAGAYQVCGMSSIFMAQDHLSAPAPGPPASNSDLRRSQRRLRYSDRTHARRGK